MNSGSVPSLCHVRHHHRGGDAAHAQPPHKSLIHGPGSIPGARVVAAHCHAGRPRCHSACRGRTPAPLLAAARRPSAIPLSGSSTSATYRPAAAAADSCSSSKATAELAPSNVPAAVCPADALALSAKNASASVPGPCTTSCQRFAARAGASSAASPQATANACHCG
nr:unnamed protein product [Digitaria exilis]